MNLQLKKNYIYLFFLFFIQKNFPLIPIKGNISSGFSFNLFPKICIDNINKNIYVASNENLNNIGMWSISVFDKSRNRFSPIISNKARINGTKTDNPLYGNRIQGIELITFLFNNDIKLMPATFINNSNSINIISDYSFYFNNLMNISQTPSLSGFTNNPGQVINFKGAMNGFCAAVCDAGFNFTASGSNGNLYGFALSSKPIFRDGKTDFDIILTQKFKVQYDDTITALNIAGGSITLNPNHFCMYGDPTVNSVFIGVSGMGTTGIRAVTVENQELAPESTCGTDSIFATTTAGQNVFINNLSVSSISTGLSYLIINGGVGSNDDVKCKVYALPLTNITNNIRLANINQYPINVFNSIYPNRYAGSLFIQEATVPTDIYTGSDVNAQVGRGPLSVNIVNKFDINQIESFRDCIFALADYNGPEENVLGGLFYSQAILDSYGRIASWTPWQRKELIGENFLTQSFYADQGLNYTIINNSNGSSVLRTDWNTFGLWNESGTNYKKLPLNSTGIQGIIDIPIFHPAFNASIGTRPSFSIYVGYNTIIINQTSMNDILNPIKSDNVNIFSNGTANGFDTTNNYTSLAFYGGELSKAGALITAALAYTDTDSWLVAAGTGGVFILCNPDGSGFGVNSIGNYFANLNSNMYWIKLGNFKNVKKLVSNNNVLYIVSNENVNKIDLSSSNIKKSNFCKVNLLFDASVFNVQDNFSFSDGAFSSNIGIVATNIGLFRNSNNTSVNLNDLTNGLSWERIILPEGDIPPIQFFTISTSGYSDDWGVGTENTISGNIYLLGTSIGYHQSKIYRFAVSGSDNKVTNNTILPINNFFIKDVPSYYFNPEFESLSIIGDGASWYTHVICSLGLIYKSFIATFDPFIKSGYISDRAKINLVFTPNSMSTFIGPVRYISGLGIWAAGASSGMYGLW